MSDIRTIQKVIKIGSSSGVTIPAKDLEFAGIQPGDNVEVTISKRSKESSRDVDPSTIATSEQILEEYEQAFKNLADR